VIVQVLSRSALAIAVGRRDICRGTALLRAPPQAVEVEAKSATSVVKLAISLATAPKAAMAAGIMAVDGVVVVMAAVVAVRLLAIHVVASATCLEIVLRDKNVTTVSPPRQSYE
jgi:hypothetical protein